MMVHYGPEVLTLSPETLLNGYSVKAILYKTPSPYFIGLASSVKTLEVKAIELHIIATPAHHLLEMS